METVKETGSGEGSAPNRPVPIFDLSRQYSKIGPELVEAARGVFETQHYILGGAVKNFEEAAAKALGANHAVGASSGTDALWLALAACGIGKGDAVVTTPFSFFATVSSILRAEATPVLADIDPETFNLSPTSVEKTLKSSTAKIRGVMPVHLYGQCADWDKFEEIKKVHKLALIEDAAQAWGSTWNGRFAGTLGDIAAFSFYPTKNLSACGDAGMISTNSDELAERAQMLRVHGMRRRYYHDEIGWNCRLDGIQGAVLLVKLKYVAEWNERRKQLAANYLSLFTKAGITENSIYPTHGVVLPHVRPEAGHAWHQYVIRVKKRDALRQFLFERKIGSEVYYPVPLHMQECLKDLGYKPGDLPESERAAQEVLALPIFPELETEEQEIVVAAICDFLS